MNQFFSNSFLLFSLLLFIAQTSISQVTIGTSEKAIEGALLDLKQNLNGTSKKGLGMPRVYLTDLAPATDALLATSAGATGTWNMETHIGLMVYNTNKCLTGNGNTMGSMYGKVPAGRN